MSFSTRLSFGIVLLTLMFSQAAHAVPPTFTGNPIRVNPDGAFVFINLRAQGVVDGAAPIQVSPGTVYINGQGDDRVAVRPVPRSGATVCLEIEDEGFTPTAGVTVAVDLTLRNPNLPGTQTRRVPFTFATGPTVPNGDPSCLDPNQRPIANAGQNRTVADTDGVAGEDVTLDGSGSTDSPYNTLAYVWVNATTGQQLSGVRQQVRLPNGPTTFRLTVTDDSGDQQTNSAQASVTITVSPPLPNVLPNANAGPDQIVSDTNNAPGENVTLNGTQSTDPDGTILTYSWSFAGVVLGTGPTITRNLPDGPNTVTLTVVDNRGGSDTDTVLITVNPPNRLPTANAGPDQTLSDTNGQPGENVTLNAGQSSDPDGRIVSYQWFENETPLGTGVTLTRNFSDGDHTIQLVVTDDGGATDDDTVLVRIAPPPNRAPTANAGPDQTLSDTNGQPGESVTLDGRQSSDSDGQIVSYQWFDGQTLLGTGATLTRNLPDGDTTVTLIVTDDDQATASDTVLIRIAVANRPPVANAGPDQTLSDTNQQPGESVRLDGSQSSDPDGQIVSYQWFRGSTVLGTGAVLQVPLQDGDNLITLVVTDDDGTTASDTLQVTIDGPTPNRAPTANAGPDQTLSDTNGQPGEVVTLDGTQSTDGDGEIVSYQWFLNQELLGSGPTLTRTLPDGTNTVTLVVTDDDEASGNDTVVITIGPPNRAPTANAGPDQTLSDTNSQPGEPVTLNGTQSSDPDGTIARYEWFLGQASLGTGATLQTTLQQDGPNTVTLVVTDNGGATGTDTVVITIAAPEIERAPSANAGPDQTLSDSDAQPGEAVTLDGRQSTDSDGTIVTYQWFIGERSLGTGATLQTRLDDGPNTVRLVVTDDDGATGTDTVVITIAAPINRAPSAEAGPDQTLSDSDQQPGEAVTLDGRQSTDTDGTIVSYQWFIGERSLGTGATLQTRLDDGPNTVRLVVTDNQQATGSDTVLITIAAPVVNRSPEANAGPDQILSDTDTQPGENVTLNGLQSSDPDGTIVSYAWFLGNTALGSGPTLQTRLPDGVNVVTLIVTDNQQATAGDTVQVSVAAAPRIERLSEIPDLTRQQLEIARGLDATCGRLLDSSRSDATLTEAQRDLQQRCRGLVIGNTRERQVAALDALTPADFSLVRTQTLLFANTQYVRVMDRLMALRGGARGLSLANLDISVDGSTIPLAELKDLAGKVFGGGASADEPGGLLNEKLGMWARGNVSFGDAEDTPGRPSFDVDQWAVIGGIDYRLSPKAVVGAAVTLGDSNIDFSASEGGLDTKSWALSLYGSLYAAKNFYFDTILNAANSSFDAQRNITYVDGVGLVSADAKGDTKGLTLSAGMSGGYDFLVGGLTVSPNVGLFYIDASVDGFTESGAGGLNLIYDDQNFTSLTGNVGLRATYAWNLPWGVILPHIRVDYVVEFQDDVEVFGVRFASDPDAQNAPPILVETDNPDSSYMRLAAGLSAQLPYGLSGYMEYQRLQGFEAISFADFSLGIRFQRGF